MRGKFSNGRAKFAEKGKIQVSLLFEASMNINLTKLSSHQMATNAKLAPIDPAMIHGYPFLNLDSNCQRLEY